MEFFDRLRNWRTEHPKEQAPMPLALPEINQRIRVMKPGFEPVASRVDDETSEELHLSMPAIPIESGEKILIAWEEVGRAYTLETTVVRLDDEARVPVACVEKRGVIKGMRDTVGDGFAAISRPLKLRIVSSRALRAGQILNTETLAASAGGFRFSTSAPLTPGDTAEVTLHSSGGEPVKARVRVVRMDSVRDSWRRLCTVTITEMLRTDRHRLAEIVGTGNFPING